MKINKSGDWKKYMQTAPQGAEVLGTVEAESGTGALVRLKKRYYSVNGDVCAVLDGRTVAGVLGKYGKSGGRPRLMAGGRMVNVYLDNETIRHAKEAGCGNLSEGIRRSVACFKKI